MFNRPAYVSGHKQNLARPTVQSVGVPDPGAVLDRHNFVTEEVGRNAENDKQNGDGGEIQSGGFHERRQG